MIMRAVVGDWPQFCINLFFQASSLMDMSIVQNRSNRRLWADIGVATTHEEWLDCQRQEQHRGILSTLK
jgi:hypothetical protein